jgi:hypothetical protein
LYGPLPLILDGEFVQARPGRGFRADRETLEQEFKRDFAAVYLKTELEPA